VRGLPETVPREDDTMIKITSIEKPLPDGIMWSGTATAGADRYEWFYVPWGRFAVRKEDATMPGRSFYVDAPEGMRRAVQRAVRAVRLGKGLPTLVITPRRADANRPGTPASTEAVQSWR
jgi:hypothetical protein